MQDINEECVVLEEVINLETAAVTDPKISKEFAVVSCGGERQDRSYIHLITSMCL